MGESDGTPFGDEAVKRSTGRDWADWCALLDGEQAAGLGHAEIVALVTGHGGGPWWSQMVAVGYERLRGLRQERQKSDGSFTASVSRTFPIAAAEAHDCFTAAGKRALWLDADVVIRTATSPKSVRLTWPDETRVNVWITDRGPAKCSVAIEHERLDSAASVEAAKSYWKAAFDRLTAAL